MPCSEISAILGGPQGAGLETSMAVLGYALARSGHGFIADREYFSNIKGRHSYIHLRISSKSVPRSLTYPVDLIAAMDPETVFTHFDDLRDGGVLIYDKATNDKRLDSILSVEEPLKERVEGRLTSLGLEPKISSLVSYLRNRRSVKVIDLNYAEILSIVGRKFKLSPQQVSRYVSSILIGAVSGLLGLDEESLTYGFTKHFRGREDLVSQNLEITTLVRNAIADYGVNELILEGPGVGLEELLVVSGNDVVAIGKIIGGLRYQSYYPITPAADESFTLEKYEKLDVGDGGSSLIVIQTEDEIAAITSAIGASLTGVRSATATSGPGFSLMVEGLSWAGMNEVPVVITYYQRGGPSTGLPTRGSQSDLLFSVFAGHGEFPRVVLSSGDHLEALYDAVEAFNIAEKYQLPVIHLLDKFLANTLTLMPLPDLNNVLIERGLVTEGSEAYKRFDLSSQVSPRAYLGSKAIMWYTGDEHDELGHICEDPVNRVRMYSKRMKKLELIDSEIPNSKKATYFGSGNPEVLMVGWGSVKGVALDAVETLKNKGIEAAYLQLRILWPFPSTYVSELLSSVDSTVIVVEHSYVVQLADLITMSTGFRKLRRVGKFTGRPIYLSELVRAVEEIRLKGVDKVVLGYGA
ncbi:MAG: 2-oxoacid:acceptor oxidoreductase subunit alpha [Desulfurococcaceae archaeon]|jgi:2-oxoglutarate ferredoxin oxidoreductase subunit alpha|nr:2-oxoacid:acceptor oxidoreductase subunit alpha [Desulfurococcaceae archaeon]